MSSCRCLHANKNTLCSSPQPVKLLLSVHKKGPTPQKWWAVQGLHVLAVSLQRYTFPFSHVNRCSTHTALKAHRECQALSVYKGCTPRSGPHTNSPLRPYHTCLAIKVSDTSQCPTTKQLPALSQEVKASPYTKLTNAPGRTPLPRWPPRGPRTSHQFKAGQRLQDKGKGWKGRHTGEGEKAVRKMGFFIAERAQFPVIVSEPLSMSGSASPSGKRAMRTDKLLSGTTD